MRCSPGVLALLLALSGCVSSGKYQALAKELDDTKATLGGRIASKDQALADKDAQIAALDARVKTLTEKLHDQEVALAEARTRADGSGAEVKRLEAQRARLEADLAATVRDRAALKASAEQLRAALADGDRRQAEAERRVAELRGLLGKLRTMIDAGQLKVKIVDGRMVLELPMDILFASGSAQLSAAGAATINQIGAALLTIPERKIQIEGHTDTVPIRTARFPSNWELGAARAITIVNQLIGAGMPATRLSAASFGEFKPVASNADDPGKAANRRVEIVVVPDLAMLPGFKELAGALAQ